MKDPLPAPLVMVVDDDVVVLDVLERLLLKWGYRTSAFRSFEEAKAQLEKTRPGPDALIVDVRLGGYNGLQLVHLTRQAHPETVIVVVSGFDDPVLRQEAALVGAKYLLKPRDLTRIKDYLPPLTAN